MDYVISYLLYEYRASVKYILAKIILAANRGRKNSNDTALIVLYHECRSLIAYVTHYLFCDR